MRSELFTNFCDPGRPGAGIYACGLAVEAIGFSRLRYLTSSRNPANDFPCAQYFSGVTLKECLAGLVTSDWQGQMKGALHG
jgi:hypothetical protein